MFVTRPVEPPEIEDHDLHWLAGLLEGEGTFLKGPPSAPRAPAVQLSMADRDVPNRSATARTDAPSTVWCIYDLRLGRTHKHLAR